MCASVVNSLPAIFSIIWTLTRPTKGSAIAPNTLALDWRATMIGGKSAGIEFDGCPVRVEPGRRQHILGL
jgi:hypothetical protein